MDNRYVGIVKANPTIHYWPKTSFLKYRDSVSKPTEVIAINESAANILLRSDGTRTVSSIASDLSVLYNTDYDEVLSMVKMFLESMSSTGCIEFYDEPKRINLTVSGTSDYAIPMHAAIEITSKCNLTCRHCYNGSGKNREDEMSSEQVVILLDELIGWGIRSIEITGGEPLCHPQIKEILQYAVDKFDLVGVITNGMLVDEEVLDIMKSSNAVSILQIDLDGCEESYVDWFRGEKGVFEKELKAIRMASEKGILMRVAMLVTPRNLNQIDQTAQLVKSLGANAFGISLVVPQGRAVDSELFLNEKQYIEYHSTFKRVSEKYKGFIYQEGESNSPETDEKNCGAGSRTVAVTPGGKIKMCQMSTESIFNFGNVFRDCCQELFEGKTEVFADIEAPSPESCGTCPHMGFCLNCIHRGVSKAKEISFTQCNWIQQYQSVFSEE